MTRSRSRSHATAASRAPSYSFLHSWDPDRYPEAYLRSGITEDLVSTACEAHLRARYRARVTVIDSGDKRLRGRLVSRFGIRGTALVGVGGSMERGIADLAVTFVTLDGRAGWFELKKPALYAPSPATGRLIQRRAAGAPTDEQLAFLEEQRRAGAIVGVAWHPLDIDAAVRAAGGTT